MLVLPSPALLLADLAATWASADVAEHSGSLTLPAHFWATASAAASARF